MADDLRQRYARLEYEQGRLWDIVDQVHLGQVSPDKDLVEAVADTIKQAVEAWRERAEKAEEALDVARQTIARVTAHALDQATYRPVEADSLAAIVLNLNPHDLRPGAAIAALAPITKENSRG